MANSRPLLPRLRDRIGVGGRLRGVVTLALGGVTGLSSLWVMWHAITLSTQTHWIVIMGSLGLILGIGGLVITLILVHTGLRRRLTNP